MRHAKHFISLSHILDENCVEIWSLRRSEIYNLNPRSGNPRADSLRGISKKNLSHSPVLLIIKVCNWSQTSAVIRQPLVKAKQLLSVENLCEHINSLSFVFSHSRNLHVRQLVRGMPPSRKGNAPISYTSRPNCPATSSTRFVPRRKLFNMPKKFEENAHLIFYAK